MAVCLNLATRSKLLSALNMSHSSSLFMRNQETSLKRVLTQMKDIERFKLKGKPGFIRINQNHIQNNKLRFKLEKNRDWKAIGRLLLMFLVMKTSRM